MAVEGVVIQVDLGIQGHDLPLARDDQGVDLDQGAVQIHEQGIELARYPDRLARQVRVAEHTAESSPCGVRAQTELGVDGDSLDRLGTGPRDLLDINPTHGAPQQ